MAQSYRKIIALTDLHITSADEAIIGLDTSDRLQLTLDHAAAHHPDAEAMILMGDLTHHGRADQYERLRGILTGLPFPVIPMLGNHDRREAFCAAFPEAPVVDGFVQGTLNFPHHRIITLDTLDGPPYPKGYHSGRLCAARLRWLREALDGLDGRIPLVFAHHPPFDTGIVGMDLIKLVDGTDLLSALQPHPRAHLFCGHIHRTISGSTDGVAWTMFKSPAHQGVLDLETPDSSLSVDEAPAYGLILLPKNGVVAHSQDVIVDQIVTPDGHSVTG